METCARLTWNSGATSSKAVRRPPRSRRGSPAPPAAHALHPTGSSWINQVERRFGFLTDQMIRRGAHKSVQALETGHTNLDQTLE